MPQIFHSSTNTLSKFSISVIVCLLAVSWWLLTAIERSDYVTQANVAREQPVPFSHKHHVGGIGIDCRYCHTSVEESAFAGISQIWANSPTLALVQESFRTDKSIEWIRVYDLPGFVYFNHSIHVKKGIGCVTCHGRVDQMPLVWRAESLYMDWCLACHREPERFVRPRQHVFTMDWKPPVAQTVLGKELVEEYNIQKLDSCSVCHR
jgi:hypothetical protein